MGWMQKLITLQNVLKHVSIRLEPLSGIQTDKVLVLDKASY